VNAQAETVPVAIVNGTPTDQFGRPYLTRPSDFTNQIEKQKEDAKKKALAEARHRAEHPELFEEDSPDDYTTEERKHRARLRDEAHRLAEDLWCLNGHKRWLTTWQDGRFLANRMRELNAEINELIEYRRHLIARYFDRTHTAETDLAIDHKTRRSKAIAKELKTTKKSPKAERVVEKKLGGLTAEQLQTLLKATGMTTEQLSQLVGK
jgi:hypothetical protein